MIVKELTYPIKAKKLEALRRRLKQNHDKAQAIELEYAKVLAGHRGELSLNYFLSFLPQEQYHILHNLRLPSAQNEYFFQMDILLLSKYFFLIIEVKNLSGSITYDPTNQQLIQHYNDRIEYIRILFFRCKDKNSNYINGWKKQALLIPHLS